MAETIISTVAERLTDLIRNEVKLLSGVEKEVLDLSNDLKTARQSLDDAERRGAEDKSIKAWLKKLEDACYEMDDVLDEWDYILLKQEMEQSDAVVVPKHKVCSFIPSSLPCLRFKKVSSRHHIAKKIQEVKAQLDQILGEKDRFRFVKSQTTDPFRIPTGQRIDPFGGSLRVQSTSHVEVEKISGRDRDRDILKAKLMSKDASQGKSSIEIISIVGLGGLGKTTLAQLVYNDNQVKDCFESKIWVCVSDSFDLVEIVKRILENLKMSSPNSNHLDLLLEDLKNSIQGKKFLLVLDDVWAEDSTEWESLKICLESGMAGSKVLVTTRNAKVAIMMGTKENRMHHPMLLSDHDCWLLLSRIALPGRSEIECSTFERTGMKIASKCKGLPLAAKMMGSLLRFKHGLDEWDSVLESEVWKLEKAERDIFPHLLLSYNELSPALKRCFSYCAVFPKDHRMNVEILISHWLALGYLGFDESMEELEQRGREYFDNLAMRSLFQDLERDEYRNHVIEHCRMHDIVHDFARYLREGISIERSEQSTCQICSPSLVSHVKQYHCLFFHNECAPRICDCLVNMRVLCLIRSGLQTLPNGLEKFIHLRHLDISYIENLTTNDLKIVCKLYYLKALLLGSCNLLELPVEIGRLIQLRHLDLQKNESLEMFPKSICDLYELRSLNINKCESLRGLPQETYKLTNLKHLHIAGAFSKSGQFPDQAIGQLRGLRTLNEFKGKLSYLKELNKLSRSLCLIIPQISGGHEIAVKEARGAELNKKAHLDQLRIAFSGDDVYEELCVGVLDALQPHSNLSYLDIEWYMGSRLPNWITSPLNQLKHIVLSDFPNLTLLPPLGKLQLLEVLEVYYLKTLEFVGRDFLGITQDMESIVASSSALVIGFPKLKRLKFGWCGMWREWEDITAEEEASTALSLFPCLKMLYLPSCQSLNVLPHRLLRKASSLEMLHVRGSPQLRRQYDERRDGSSWKFISHIPRFKF